MDSLQLNERLPRVAGAWLAFDPSLPEERARERFVRRYGQEPERVVKAGCLLLVGPVPDREGRQALRAAGAGGAGVSTPCARF